MRILYKGAVLGMALAIAACSHFPGATSTTPSAREDNLIQLAQSTATTGDLKAAEDMYKQAIELSSGAVAAHLELADLYLNTKRPDQAESILKDALALQPKNADVLIALGNLLISENHPDKALEYLDRAVAAAPKEPRALNSKGVALDAAGSYTQAQALYIKALALRPQDTAYIKNNLGLSYILSEKYDDAIRVLSPMARDQKARPIYRQNLAMAYGLKGDYARALALGVKDLPEEDAKENVEFYRYLVASRPLKKPAKGKTQAKVETAVTPVEVKSLPTPKLPAKPTGTVLPTAKAKPPAAKPKAEEDDDAPAKNP